MHAQCIPTLSKDLLTDTKFFYQGKEWLRSFLNRNKLTVRVPEATSLARQAGFNKMAVEAFYDNLAAAMDK